MKRLRGVIVLMAALALLATACGSEEATVDTAAQAAAEAQAAAAQAEAQEAADAATAAQAALEATQAELEAAQAAAAAGGEEAQAALEAAQEAADEAQMQAEEARTAAEVAQAELDELEESMVVMAEAPEIRTADVRMGIYPCCADLAYWQIPIELGWWDELNITITPNQPTFHYFTASQEIVPWLQRGDGDVAQGWVPGVFGTLETFGQDIPPIHFADIYVGYAILVAPDSEAKTALEFMDEGMSFSDAATAAVEQLVGKEVHIPPHSTTQAQYSNAFFAYLPQWWEDVNVEEDIPVLDSEGNQQVLLDRDGNPVLDDDGNPQPIRITTNDWRNYATPVYVDDPTIVQLSAAAGRIEFAMPYGAPTLVQMMRNGWDPLINFVMMYEHDAASQQTAIASSTVGGTGLLARREWVEENKDLAYRIISVANRIFEYLEDPATQRRGWEIEANLINEKRSLDMEPEDIGIIWDTIDPSFNWADQEALWDLSLPSYHPETVFRTQIEQLKSSGVLSENFNTQAELEEFLLAQELYYDLRGFQESADDLFARAQGMDLSESQQDLIDQAQVFYDRYNFYDADRFLKAALIG